ncbi:hypothetical protein [Phocoenobacter skyensis]|uniref:Uncharacterized protein n=1 Tax=Phocoenobacter skyensis TaxID=97481 RepID=A0A1H7YEU8_9PAST|nr:hypothetical protein [Pasteurella skyensis]MDP8079714.1 hypothetical protein [Pasteurella skyensis]MDP8085711.1 hypothetical protein [Pasteurella skyensis]MDP8185480.1 hypothetical protein [Pasteurella skyensis]QLB22312.1 hypothetical protein A6B44_03490 [Pasteurella skyensis]SEM43847.1 hypothetical protein SAMN05444853_1183 [Pasteurella skyensis]
MNKTLQQKLYLLKIKQQISEIKGIDIQEIVYQKPEILQWFDDELRNEFNKIERNIPIIAEISYLEEKNTIAKKLQEIVYPQTTFILDFGELYLIFSITSFSAFLNSLNDIYSSRDVTLFFSDQPKLVDIHLAEHFFEFRILAKG